MASGGWLIFDNMVLHWFLKLHRLLPGNPFSLHAELVLILLGLVLFLLGLHYY